MYAGQLRLALADYQPDGRMRDSRLVPLDVRYSAEHRDKALQDGIDFPGVIKVGDLADRLRVVVFDRGSDAVGSLTIPVGSPTEEIRRSPDPKTGSNGRPFLRQNPSGNQVSAVFHAAL